MSQYHGRRFSCVNGSRNGSCTWSTGVIPLTPAVSLAFSPKGSLIASPLTAKTRMISPKARVTIAM